MRIEDDIKAAELEAKLRRWMDNVDGASVFMTAAKAAGLMDECPDPDSDSGKQYLCELKRHIEDVKEIPATR